MFSAAVQRRPLPRDVYRRLQATIARGAALDPGLAGSVAQAMKDWALEQGATHYAQLVLSRSRARRPRSTTPRSPLCSTTS